MGAGASAGGDGQLLPPTKNPAAIPIFSGLEELQAKLVEKGSWTEGDRDEIGELLAAARVFYDLQIEGAKRVQAQLAAKLAQSKSDFCAMYGLVFKLVQQEAAYPRAMEAADRLEAAVAARGPQTRQAVNRIDVLYESSALRQKPPFDAMVRRLGADAKALDVKVAPLKSLARAFEKTAMKKADDNRFDSDRLLDLVRGMLVFQTVEGVAAALELLADPKDRGWTVVRIKNRMREPTGGGWADVLLNLKANDDANHFICELQLVHKKMLVTREELGGHDAYNEFRTASEFLELVQEGAEAGVTAGLERELAAARKDRNGRKCKELKARIERIKALDAEIKELEAAEAAAFDGDDFDEGDRLHGELEARRARFQELTAKAAGDDAVDAPVVKKATDGASAPSEAEPIKVLQSITDASAVATASMPPLDPSKLVELRTLRGHSKDVSRVAVFPDGRRVVSASWDKTLKVWDIATGECVATLEGHSNGVVCVAVFPDGRRVVSGSSDNTLKVWDVATGECVATLEGHSNSVRSVAIFPDGRRVVSGSLDNTLKVWDVATGECVATLEGHSYNVNGVAVFPDGRRIVSCDGSIFGGPGVVKVWDVATGKCLATLQGHSDGVTSVAVFPDGRRVVSGSWDNTLKVWDIATGECVATLQGHLFGVRAVAVFPDGRRVVSGSLDNTLKVWDVATGECVATLEGHSDTVFCVAISPDGRRVVSGSQDNTLKLWGIK